MAILTSGRFDNTTATNKRLINESKIWAGGGSNGSSFSAVEPIFLADEAIVIGDGVTLKGQLPDQSSDTAAGEAFNDGVMVLRNSTVDASFFPASATTHAGRSGLSWDLENVIFTTADGVYSVFGAWVGDSAGAIPRFVNVSFLGPVGDNFLSALSPFFGAAGTSKTFTGGNADTGGNRTVTSAFEGVSYWNGESLESGRALGGSPQLFTGATHAAPVFGPFGINLNGSGHRCIARFSNQNNTNTNLTNRANHNSLSTGLDIRSLQQVQSSFRFYIGADSGAHIKHINPLLGFYRNGSDTADLRPVFVRQFGGGATQQILVATNPLVSNDSGDHRYTFTADQVTETTPSTGIGLSNGGLYIMPATWDIFTVQSLASGQMHDNILNGFAFQQLNYNGNSLSNGIAPSVSTPITALSDETYRKYSWRQQPDNTTFGRAITVRVPGDNASEIEVSTARASGFDQHNGANFTTHTDVNDPIDLITSQSAVDTPTKADTVINQLGGVNTASYVVVGAKYNAWDETGIQTRITDDNLKSNLGYEVTGTTVVFDHDLGLSSTETSSSRTNGLNPDGLSLPIGDLPVDEFINRIEGEEVTITGDALNTTTVKPTIVGNIHIDTEGANITNATLIGGTGTGANELGGLNNVNYSSVSTTGTTTIFNNIGSNNTITTGHTLNAGVGGFNTGDNNLISSPIIINWSVTHTHGTTIFDRDMSVNLINVADTNPTLSAIDIFGHDDFSNGNEITLRANAAVTIRTNNPNAVEGTNVTIEQLPATNTWVIPTAVSGHYAVDSVIGGVTTQLVEPTSFLAGRNVSGTITGDDFSAADGDHINIYIKYNSVVTEGSPQYYVEQLQSFNFSDTDGTVHTLNVEATEVSDVLYNTQSNIPSDVFPTAFADGNNVEVRIRNTTDNETALNINGPQSLQLIALIGNLDSVFNAYYRNKDITTEPMITYGQGFLANIDQSRITLESGNVNSGGFRITHTVNNWVGTGTGTFALSRTGSPEIISVIASLAIVDPATITLAINNSTVAMDAYEANNKVSYSLIGDGTRTNKFKPASANYNNETNYTNDDE